MLAEGPSIDGRLLLIGLIILVVVLAAMAALVILGFVLASRAARGSESARAGWVAVLIVEGLFSVASLSPVLRGRVSVYEFVFPVIVAAQVRRFVLVRRRP
ncbi:MAG: hypothetical protein ACRDS0_39420 [Pseudonocardiaceae bacterium]